MNFKVLLLVFICWSTAKADFHAIVKGSVISTTVPRKSMTWSGRLVCGAVVSACALYKTRKTRHTNFKDLLEPRYVGRIGKKIIRYAQAERLLRGLIRAAYGR